MTADSPSSPTSLKRSNGYFSLCGLLLLLSVEEILLAEAFTLVSANRCPTLPLPIHRFAFLSEHCVLRAQSSPSHDQAAFCPVVRLVSRFKWSFVATTDHSRNFKNFTIHNPGSPFLMAPVQELALEEKKKMSDVSRMSWNLTGCPPPSYSWTQAEGSRQMPTEQMKVIDVKFPFKLLFEKLVLSFYWLCLAILTSVSSQPVILSGREDERRNPCTVSFLVFPLQGTLSIFLSFLSDHHLIFFIDWKVLIS